MSEQQAELEIDKLREWQADLEAKAQQLRVEIADRTERLRLVEEQLSLLTRLLELSGIPRDSAKTIEDGQIRTQVLAPKNGEGQFEDEVEKILKEHGKPMHISDIRSALIDADCEIPGRGDDANIIVRIRRYPDRFTRTARGTYALADWGLPEMKTKSKRARAGKFL
jgi:hypothetical protein